MGIKLGREVVVLARQTVVRNKQRQDVRVAITKGVSQPRVRHIKAW
jgi:hypothetical protein